MSEARTRIGQTIWPALRCSRGAAGIDALVPLLAEYPPGGVIVFGEGEPHVEQLIAALRLRAGGDLLIAADLERGCGQQVCERTSLPPAMAIAACQEPDAAFEAGLLTGQEARACGIDVVFAPVADVNTAATNPIIATRSFGDDPLRVASLASAFARGLAQGGVLAVGKHFPGHGSTVQDSHEVLARVTRDEAALQEIDLVPFRTLVAEGIGGLMVGHLEVPALDPVPGRPATASPNVVLDHLRRRLGFDGLVVTDALDMGGFRSEPAAALDVLQSGLDVLLMPADPLATARTLHAAHTARHLADEVLDAAVARIAAARAAVRSATPSARRVRPALAERLLAGSLTLRSEQAPRLQPGSPVDLALFGEDDSGMVVPALIEALEVEGIVRRPGAPTLGLVITSVRAWKDTTRLPERVRQRLHWAAANGRLSAVVVLGSPYELLELPDGVPALLAYEATPSAAQAVVRVLCGRAEAPGLLPVGQLLDHPVNLARFLDEERVDLDLDSRFDAEEHPATIDTVTEHMAGLLARSDAIVNANKLRLDLVNRERRAPSLLGRGVAMPHVRTLQARRLVMAVGLSRAGLHLPTPDGQPVQLVVALVGPTYDDRLYLQVYKRLGEHFTEEGWLQRVLEAGQPGEVVRTLSD